MKNRFVSLHNHSHIGSPLDGMNSIEDLVQGSEDAGHPGFALTDHGSMSALYDAWKVCKKINKKFVPGNEFYFTEILSPENKKNYHLVLLAQNELGYRNLLKLNLEAFKNQSIGFLGKGTPRISFEQIEKYNEGVIALTACSNGIISKTLISDQDIEKAELIIKKLHSTFQDRFFLELQPHALVHVNEKTGKEVNQVKLNEALLKYSRDFNIPYVITCDSHYRNKEMAATHDLMLAVKDHKGVDDPARFRYGVTDMYFKPEEEIISFFGNDVAQVGMANAAKIFDGCELPSYLEGKGPILPKFPVKDTFDYSQFRTWFEERDENIDEDKAYLRYKCIEGFKEKTQDFNQEKKSQYWERTKKELEVLELRNFSSYLLIVADYFNWAKENKIPTGPGRGCLTGDALVLTKQGYKRLDSIKIGDIVYSHTGELRNVSDVMSYEINEELLSLKTGHSFGAINLTKDHKIYGVRRSKTKVWENSSETLRKKVKVWNNYSHVPNWIAAQELNIGDLLFTKFPKRSMKWNINSYDLSLFATGEDYSVEGDIIKKRVRPENNALSKRYISKSLGLARNVISNIFDSEVKSSVNTLNQINSYLKAFNLSIDDWKNYLNNSYIEIKRQIPCDEDFCYLVGRWIGDGWITNSSGKSKSKRYSWGIAFNSNDEKGISKIENYLITLGFIPTRYKHNTKQLIQLNVNDKLLYIFFRNLFPTYEKISRTKCIGDFKSLPDNLLKQLLLGLLDSDGYTQLGTQANKHSSRECIDSTSEILILDIREALLYLKIPSRIAVRKPYVRKQNDKEYECRQSYKIVFSGLRMKKQAQHIFEDGFYSEVLEINTCKANRVYDITVEQDHSYLTQNYVVHNSVVGSIVAYFTGVTKVDPIKHDLLFERFHNREKKAYPDIDLDFSKLRRSEVQRYLKNKYGEDKVAGISNWNTLAPKVVIKDVSRSLDIGGNKSATFKIADSITKSMPNEKTIEAAEKSSKKFAEFMVQYPKVRKYSSQLQGLVRNWGVHAAGLVLSDRPLVELVPLRIDEDGDMVLQWEKERTEEFGLVKMDILGLDTLDVIEETIQLIKKTTGEEIDINLVSMEDPETFKMISTGETMGVFQLESSLAPLCAKIKPKNVDDISDINALGRPSCPADARQKYINRRSGVEPITYLHPNIENALKRTYGVSLYEESMMTLAKDCAGWDLNQSDALRKITKLKGKNPELVEQTRSNFINDSIKHSKMSQKQAADVWKNEIESFGGYGFNRAHSVAYSYISYQTAWLKRHYPTQFMCALLNSEKPNEDKVLEYLVECNKMGIKITPPDINSSKVNYVITGDKQIATGLISIKGVGEKALEQILSAQPFQNLEDFFYRTTGRVVNKRVIQALAKSGAFESLDRTRKDVYDNYEKYRIKVNAEIKSEKSLDAIKLPRYDEEWNRKELLLGEREILGRTVSGSLHEIFTDFFRANSSVTPLRTVKNLEPGDRVKVEVIINSKIKEFTIKNGKSVGKKFAKYLIEDAQGTISSLTVWNKDYEKYNHLLKDGLPIKAICAVSDYMEQKELTLSILEAIFGKEI